MLSGFLPSQLSAMGVFDWLMIGVGLAIGSSVAMVIFQPLENSLSSDGSSILKGRA